MGFPRILSKNNKICTKLGDFCLSGDSFWIVCHTCQEELQTQEQFWKHIQDEHNFLNGTSKELTRSGGFLMDVETTTDPLVGSGSALPLYNRKYKDKDERHKCELKVERPELQRNNRDSISAVASVKECTDIQSTVTENGKKLFNVSGGINIKLEPTLQPEPAESQVGNSTIPRQSTLYQLHPQAVPVPPPSQPISVYSSNATTTMQVALPTFNMSVTPSTATAAAAIPLLATTQDILPKDSNSTTASASSAISSDDGERLYTCDYETCGLKFKYQSRLQLHRVVHSKERRFACELCGASFKQSCNLSTHRKKKHSLKGSKNNPEPLRF